MTTAIESALNIQDLEARVTVCAAGRCRRRGRGRRNHHVSPRDTGATPVRWATRARIHVDRAACAWLIVRFIDPDAEFVFVHDPADVPSGATPFDMRGVCR
jgi:ChrB, C-terminal domain